MRRPFKREFFLSIFVMHFSYICILYLFFCRQVLAPSLHPSPTPQEIYIYLASPPHNYFFSLWFFLKPSHPLQDTMYVLVVSDTPLTPYPFPLNLLRKKIPVSNCPLHFLQASTLTLNCFMLQRL